MMVMEKNPPPPAPFPGPEPLGEPSDSLADTPTSNGEPPAWHTVPAQIGTTATPLHTNVLTDYGHALGGISAQELEEAVANVLGSFQQTPADVPLKQRLMSRKLWAWCAYEVGVIATTVMGGLPHAEAGMWAGIGTAVYLAAQAVVDAAQQLNAPPPGFTAVRLPPGPRA